MTYARALLRNVAGYVPGEQPKLPNIIKLNTNENPYPPSPRVFDALAALAPEALRRYPDPVALELRSVCAERYGHSGPEWVFAGNGMDEVLAMTIRGFVDPGDTVLAGYPTYILYETLARLHGAAYNTFELDGGFQLPEEAFRAKGRMCFITRPNAPSGVCIPRESIERFCDSFPGIVFIDEAYADFAQDNCLDFPKRFDNVLVGRTFSKSFSLAGMRIGTVTGNPSLIAEFLKTKDSYNLNAFSQAAATAAMRDYAYMQTNVAKITATRRRLIDGLRSLGFEVPDSQANFVLARSPNSVHAREIFEQLRARAIIVRYFDAPRLRDALRISVGTDDETASLLAALREILRAH